MHCYLDKRGDSPNWYICVYDTATGRVRRISTHTADRAIAERQLAQYIIKLPQQQLSTDTTIAHVMLRYWEHKGKGSFARDTVKRVLSLVGQHEPFTRVYDWPIGNQEAFAAKLASKASTRRRYFGVVRSALQWSVDRGELPHMPGLLKIEARDGAGVRAFSVSELQALCAAAKHEHEVRFLLLCIATVARPGAVLDLTWDRVNIEAGFADLDNPERKQTKKRRACAPLAPAALSYLSERRSVGPVVQWAGKQLGGHKMTFARIAKKAEVTGTGYGIRHGVATWLRRQGVPYWDVQAMLGHSMRGVTDRYARFDPQHMGPAVQAIQSLLEQIRPWFLASHLPDTGGRDRDRTCDPYHVKVAVDDITQGLKVANDD